MTTFEVLQEIVDHSVVEIFSSQMGISGSSLDLENTFLDSQQRNIEGTSTKIENENILLLSLLVKTVGNSGGGGLVNDTENVESRNGTTILGSLSPRVVKVGRNGDDSVLLLNPNTKRSVCESPSCLERNKDSSVFP